MPLYVNWYKKQKAGNRGDTYDTHGEFISSQTISDISTSQQTNAAPTGAYSAMVVSTNAAHILTGSNPTAVADSTSEYLPAGVVKDIVGGIKEGVTKIAGIDV